MAIKKILSASAIASCLFSLPAFSADGTLNFTGSITDASCTVTNSVSTPLTVPMGQISSTAFNGAGSTAAPTRFTIALTSCPATVTSASVKFDGTANATVPALVALTPVTGVATGVGIQIADVSGKEVPLFGTSDAFNLAAGSNNLAFVARYYATAATVTAGPANGTANFTIIYN